jgi:soluble lytic murein transglycosylase-like protein
MKTARPFLLRLSTACLWVALTLNVQAAAPKAAKSAAQPGTSEPTTQAERAEAAMAKSLEQQQASLDGFNHTFGTASAPASFQQQQASLQQQSATLTGQDKGTVGSWAVANVTGKSEAGKAGKQATPPSQPDVAQSEPAQDDFFAVPWPSSTPLVVPNVQMMDDSCQALGKSDVDQLIEGASKKHGVDVDLLRSVMRQESGFKPCAVSVAGAMGLMQIMPGTAEMLKLDDPFDPQKNVDAGASFLKMMLDRYQGNVTLALGAYNAGPGSVDKAGGVPPIAETMQYITNILGDLPLAY